MARTFVGLTGASGHAYGEALVRALVDAGEEVDLCLTPAGAKVLKHELGIDAGPAGQRLPTVLADWLGASVARGVSTHDAQAVEAPPSSGTARTRAVVLCPCSMGTLARISVGFSSNLIERAADVALKEGRTLLLVPREAPYSSLHLENMLRLARAGAVILPASPGFYHRPSAVGDLIDHVVGKIMDRLGLSFARGARWRGPTEPPEEAGTGRPVPPDPLAHESHAATTPPRAPRRGRGGVRSKERP
jgi:4-hydroxy-3-polyprenylbenzoate decarboxylase